MSSPKVIFSKQQVEEALDILAHDISNHYSNIDSPLVILPVLNGGVFFYVDLVRRLTIPSEMGTVLTSHYPKEKNKNFDGVLLKSFDAEVSGRHVLIVDEICFTGKTFTNILSVAYSNGATDVKTAALIHQLKEDAVHIPDWYALQYVGTDWIYGYGMDLDGLHREKMDILA